MISDKRISSPRSSRPGGGRVGTGEQIDESRPDDIDGLIREEAGDANYTSKSIGHREPEWPMAGRSGRSDRFSRCNATAL